MRAKEKTGHVFMHRLKDARTRFGIARANSRCSQQGKAPELVKPHTGPHFPISTTCQCSLRSCCLSQVPHPTPPLSLPLTLPLPRRASLSCLFLKSICKAAAFRLAPTCYVGEAAAVAAVLCLAPAQLPILHRSHRYFTFSLSSTNSCARRCHPIVRSSAQAIPPTSSPPRQEATGPDSHETFRG